MGTSDPVYGTDRVIADALRERKRQVVVEGFTRTGDDQHEPGRLALAAASYLISWAAAQQIGRETGEASRVMRAALEEAGPPDFWPMDPQWWKPHNDRHDLIRAIALAIAEVEHHDRGADSHPRREQLTAFDDQIDRQDHEGGRILKVGDTLNVHLAPGHRLAAIGDRVLIEPSAAAAVETLIRNCDGELRVEGDRTVVHARASEVAQQFPADHSAAYDDGGLNSPPAVESSPPATDCTGGGE